MFTYNLPFKVYLSLPITFPITHNFTYNLNMIG